MGEVLEVELGGLFLHNDSFDYNDYYAPKDESVSRQAATVLVPLLLSVVLAVGVCGNVLVLVFLVLKRKCWGTSDIFILHLGLSDVLLLITLPFWAAQVAQPLGWCCGLVWCRINGAFFNISFYSGALLLTFVAAERYLSVVRSLQLFTQRTPRLAHIACVLIWLASVLLSIPDFISLMYVEEWNDYDDKTCSCVANVYRSKWLVPSRIVHHLVYVFPVVALIVFFYFILTQLQESAKAQQKLSTITLILALVLVFYLCWSPYNITLIVDTWKGHLKTHATPERTALLATLALACVHACLRPIVYLVLCGKFQEKALGVVRCQDEVGEGDLWELGVGSDSTPNQSSDPEEMKQMNDRAVPQMQQGQC